MTPFKEGTTVYDRERKIYGVVLNSIARIAWTNVVTVGFKDQCDHEIFGDYNTFWELHGGSMDLSENASRYVRLYGLRFGWNYAYSNDDPQPTWNASALLAVESNESPFLTIEKYYPRI